MKLYINKIYDNLERKKRKWLLENKAIYNLF